MTKLDALELVYDIVELATDGSKAEMEALYVIRGMIWELREEAKRKLPKKHNHAWEQGGYDRDGHRIIYCVHCGEIFTIDDHDLDNPVYHSFNKEDGTWMNAVTLAK